MGVFRTVGKLLKAAEKGAAAGKAQHIRQKNEMLLALLGKLGIRPSVTGDPRADVPMNWALLLVWMTADGFNKGLGSRKPYPKDRLLVPLGVVDYIAEMLCAISGQGEGMRMPLTATAANILFFTPPPPDYRVVAETAKKQHTDFYAKGHDKAMDDIVTGVHDIFKKQDLEARQKITSGIEVLMTAVTPIAEPEWGQAQK